VASRRPSQKKLRELSERAVEIHALAKAYGVDPWTVVNEWSLGQYDLNRAVLAVAIQEEERRAKLQEAQAITAR